MSGVIDENDQQWERCNVCCEYVKFEELGYIKPCHHEPIGADVCVTCAAKKIESDQVDFDDVVPGKQGWVETVVECAAVA